MGDKELANGVDNPTPQSLVTAEHVQAALRKDKGPDARLTSWGVEDFTRKGDNYACVVSSVRASYTEGKEGGEVVYVVKLNPCRNLESFREFTHTIFEKECRFYLSLVPELNRMLEGAGQTLLRVPRCYHGTLENDREMIFLEDLRPKGFKMFDRKKGLDVAHATLILQELARLHAASVLLQAETPDEDLSEKYSFLKRDWLDVGSDSPRSIQSLFDGYLRNAIEILETVGGYERAIAWVESLRPDLEQIFKTKLGLTKFNVVCHGDCWNNNVLFRYDEEGCPVEVMLLDLQLCRRASPATDLNYLLYTSITGDVRKPNLEKFLASYYAVFASVLRSVDFKDFPSEKELTEAFREHNVIAAIFAIMIVPIVLMESEDVPELSTLTDDNLDDVMDEFKGNALKLLDSNPMMKPRFLSMFDEFMETGLIP